MSHTTHPTVKPPTPLFNNDWVNGFVLFFKETFSFFKIFRSVQLAITLLSLLAIGVLIGVFMPQEGLVEVADIKQQYGQNYYLFKAMGLFNVYSSAWFIAVEILFFFNMLFGSFQWLKPAWLAATRRTFCGPEHMVVSPNHFQLINQNANPNTATEQIKATLKKHGYHVFEKPEKKAAASENQSKISLTKLYAAKGNFSRIAPVMVHFGILCMLLSSVYGAFTGFKANQLMVPGQEMAFPNFDEFNPNMSQPYWQGNVPDYQLKLHDFTVNYYPDNPTTAKQYYSDLEAMDKDGNTIKRQRLSVNTPLQLNDLMIYQASFAPTGKLFLEVDGKPTEVEVNTEFQNRPISMSALGDVADQVSLIVFPFFTGKDPGTLYNNVRVFIHKGTSFAGAAPGKMPENLQLFEGEDGTIGGHTIRYIKPELATGFLVKKAPETLWIYLAFGIICLGATLCIFSQRQIWVAIEQNPDTKENHIYVHYKTNKAKLSFAQELVKLKEKLTQTLNASPLEPTAQKEQTA